MTKIAYISKTFRQNSLWIIKKADEIIQAYQNQGMLLTLRQLYYRFVAADLIPNQQKEYQRLGSIINDARLAGYLDWEAIEDRGRHLLSIQHWGKPEEIIRSAANSYSLDKWKGQKYRVEVWVEKEALISVIGQAAEPYDCAYYACKGYVSQSEMWRASLRFQKYYHNGQTPVIIHLGDHDPSGMDMTRDIKDRLAIFEMPMEINRIALNMDQIDEHSPPPNPTKLTDSRARGYIMEFGDDSWELDALEPKVLKNLVSGTIKSYVDQKIFNKVLQQEENEKQVLMDISDYWEDVVDLVCEK